MEEKQIIKNNGYSVNFLAIIFALIGIGFLIFGYSWIEWAIFDFGEMINNMDGSWAILVGWVFVIVAVITFCAMNACELVVTDKRVYGKAAFGKRVDLPFDMISSVGGGLFGSIGVATSSGNIRFWLIKNRDEIFSSITNLLIDRQNNKANSNQSNTNTADELKKYKDLLDAGVITQGEFDAKKKELLGL